MIRFIDIESGNVFNGSQPYVFWMDKEQSVNLIYVKKICVMTDSSITVSLPSNSVFRLLDMSRLNELVDVNINEFKYKDIQQLYTNNLTDEGITYQGCCLHMIYIAAQSDSVGEVHENFTINNEEFEIAADFYPENESLRINLANFGVEIPESIQTAIYDENVHEESKDNILLNRKYKELLLNYWSIVAGRGSYKSLIDSLNWFEYGDLVKIEEIWRHDEWGQTRLNREELNTIMTEEVRTTLSNFTKTTYLGIYAALQKYLRENGEVQYEKLNDLEVNLTPEQSEVLLKSVSSNNYEGLLGEMVPKLESMFFKWSIQEMSLKMYLLGSFYEAYFMPIHLDLMHSTIESLVFTNTIKCLNATFLDRCDHVYNTQAFECNITDNSTYQLQDVHVQGGDSLRQHWDSSDDSSDDSTNMVNVYEHRSTGEWEDDFVDLGLPSGTLWRNKNLGATSETDYGNLFAWGETTTKEEYTTENYKWGPMEVGGPPYYPVLVPPTKYYPPVDSLTNLKPEDDAAHAQLGRDVRTPSREDFTELINNTTQTYYQGDSEWGTGMKFESANGNYIFIPFNIINYREYGVWTSHVSSRNSCYADYYDRNGLNYAQGYWRATGYGIRPVKNATLDTRSIINSDDSGDSSDDYDNYPIFGVEDEYNHPMQYDGESSDDTVVNDRLKTFMINNYNGQGVILPFECMIPAEEGDFINSEKIIISVYRDETLYSNKVLNKHDLYRETQGKYAINFNLLLTQEGKTVITLYFTSAGGRSYIKVLHLNVVGDSLCKLKLFRVRSSSLLTGLNVEDYQKNIKNVIAGYPFELQSHVRRFNDYMFTHTRDTALGSYQTFIPSVVNDINDSGAKLNYVLIFDASFFDNPYEPGTPEYIDREGKINLVLSYTKDDETQGWVNMFDIGKKEVRDANDMITKTYYILISKVQFGFVGDYDSTVQIIESMRKALNKYILRYSTGFFFQHHYLEEIGLKYNPDTGHYEYGLSLDDYTITDKDTICVVPDMKYSNIKIDETEWIFRNVSTKDKEEYRYESIEEPFINNNVKKQLKPGFYDVIFRYRIDQTDNEVKLCSAFRKI